MAYFFFSVAMLPKDDDTKGSKDTKGMQFSPHRREDKTFQSSYVSLEALCKLEKKEENRKHFKIIFLLF